MASDKIGQEPRDGETGQKLLLKQLLPSQLTGVPGSRMGCLVIGRLMVQSLPLLVYMM